MTGYALIGRRSEPKTEHMAEMLQRRGHFRPYRHRPVSSLLSWKLIGVWILLNLLIRDHHLDYWQWKKVLIEIEKLSTISGHKLQGCINSWCSLIEGLVRDIELGV